MSKKTKFEFRGVTFEVGYTYDHADEGDEFTPPSGPEVSINWVYLNTTNMTDFFLANDPSNVFEETFREWVLSE